MDGNKPYLYYAFSYKYIPVIKFDLSIRHHKRLTIITNKTIITTYCNKNYVNMGSLSNYFILLYSFFLRWCELINACVRRWNEMSDKCTLIYLEATIDFGWNSEGDLSGLGDLGSFMVAGQEQMMSMVGLLGQKKQHGVKFHHITQNRAAI